MNIFDELSAKFNTDEPILIEDIEKMYPQRSRPWIDKAIKTLVDSKQLKRFSTGVYYIPRKTVLGDSVLNPRIIHYITLCFNIFIFFGADLNFYLGVHQYKS